MATITDILEKLSADNKSILFEIMRLTIEKIIPSSGKSLNVNKCSSIRTNTSTKCSLDLYLDNYRYTYPNATIGWIEDNINRFKIAPFTYQNPRTDAYNINTIDSSNLCATTSTKNTFMILSFNDSSPTINYPNLQGTIQPNRINKCQKKANVVNLLQQKQIQTEYESNLPYVDSFKQLKKIGVQLLNELTQKNANTTKLRRNLLMFDNDLLNFKTKYPDLYNDYIDLIVLINSINGNSINLLINLISTLTYQNYNDLSQNQKNLYETVFGTTFINNFNRNNLINLILDTQLSELIVSSAYIYSTLKALFCLFGYSEIIPRFDPLVCKPINKCVYEKINKFNEIYPNITEIMGGTSDIPNECVLVDCNKIPNNYNGLDTIPGYLWRWNDYSYCKYLEYTAKNDKMISMSTKISNKTKYINSV